MAKSLKLLAVMLASLAVTVFLFRHQNSDISSWATLLLMMFLIYIPFGVPAVGTFIHDRPRAIFWTGIAMIIGGLAAFFVIITLSAFYGFPPGITGADPISRVTMWIMMAGVFLAILPRSMAALKRTEKAAAAVEPAQSRMDKFDGLENAWAAISEVARNWAAFARFVGPWILLLWAVPFIGLHIVAYHYSLTPNLFAAPPANINAATELFAERFPSVIVSALAFPIALVSWHRFVVLGKPSAFGWNRPGDTLRYLWRLWMVTLLFSVFLRLVSENAPDVARLLGTQDKLLVAQVLFWAVVCIAIYLGSAFALVFPAVAVGNRNFAGTDSARITKPLGHSFRVGFVVSLLPLGIGWWGISAVLDHFGLSGPQLSVASYSVWLLPTTMMFFGLATCATYLSRVYAAQQRRDDCSADPPAIAPRRTP